jgi:hypothetical protein
MSNHKLNLTRRQNYIEADCKCGQWSQFATAERKLNQMKIDWIKSQYRDHKELLAVAK